MCPSSLNYPYIIWRKTGQFWTDISKVFSELSPVELRSLHYIQSNEFLKDHNMKDGDRGEVVDSNGEIFFPIGTLKAVRKVLNSN